MLKAGLVLPLLELCCGSLETRPPQQSEDSLRCTMLVVHEVLKNRPLHGMADFVHGLSAEQVRAARASRLPASACSCAARTVQQPVLPACPSALPGMPAAGRSLWGRQPLRGAQGAHAQAATGKALVEEAKQLLRSFFQPERVRRLMLAILHHFLPLTVRPQAARPSEAHAA